jgi:hypothetical protein
MPFENPNNTEKDTQASKVIKTMSQADIESDIPDDTELENDPIILEKKADILKEQLQTAVNTARESNTDADLEKARKLMEQYRDVVYKLRPEANPENQEIESEDPYIKYEVELRDRLARENDFDYVSSFKDVIAWVYQEDNGYFYIDKQGNRINQESYDGAGSFNEGIVRVKKGTEYFYIDTRGQRVFSYK